jgi:hypothetical protein
MIIPFPFGAMPIQRRQAMRDFFQKRLMEAITAVLLLNSIQLRVVQEK